MEYYTALKIGESKVHTPTLEQSDRRIFVKYEATVTNFLGTWKLHFGNQTVL